MCRLFLIILNGTITSTLSRYNQNATALMETPWLLVESSP